MPKKMSKNIATVLEILKNEVDGNVTAALQKMTEDYSMTWVYLGTGKQLFPTTKLDVKKELEEVYPIKGRTYEIKNIAEGNNVVMVELIESYPDPKTHKKYRTPLVLVLEMKQGKIRTGRHYLDPRLSNIFLTPAQVRKIYKNGNSASQIIK
jgi:ketosteroid isomerase-like protein